MSGYLRHPTQICQRMTKVVNIPVPRRVAYPMPARIQGRMPLRLKARSLRTHTIVALLGGQEVGNFLGALIRPVDQRLDGFVEGLGTTFLNRIRSNHLRQLPVLRR